MGQAEQDIKRPTATKEMYYRGAVFGFLFAMLYFFIAEILFQLNATLPIFERLFTYGFLSAFLGAGLGEALGILIGGAVEMLLRRQTFPLDIYGFRRTGYRVQVITLVIMLLVWIPLAILASFLMGFYWYSFPMVVSIIAAMYAMHRYMQKLKHLGFVHERKSKAKYEMSSQLTGHVSTGDDTLSDDDETQQDRLINS